jgi:hypothetical protein
MTQPVYDPAVLERFLDDVAAGHAGDGGDPPAGEPRNAEFLHNEVPGMSVPDDPGAHAQGGQRPRGAQGGRRPSRARCSRP